MKKLVLTDKSQEIHRLMTEDFDTIERMLCQGFSETELEQFFEYIHRMQNNMKIDKNNE